MPSPLAEFIRRCRGAGGARCVRQYYGLERAQHADTQKRQPSACAASCACEHCSGVLAFTYRAAHGRIGLVKVNRDADVVVDDKTVSASCILASSNRDWAGDVIECVGVDVSTHRFNPVTLFDHARTYHLPIGKCESPDGEYTVKYHPDSDLITETTFFAPDRFSRQVYALVKGGYLRSNSIAVKDVEVRRLPADPERGLKAGKHILKSILAEVTWTPLPVNPDATASLLGKGRIDAGGMNAQQIEPLLYKSLLPFVPRRKVWANGFTLTEKSNMPDPKAQAAAQAELTRKDDMPDEASDTQMSDEPEGEEESLPGASALRDFHDFLSAGKDLLDAHGKGQENDAVREALADAQAALEALCEDVREVFAAEYPDEDPLGPEPDAEEASEEDSDTEKGAECEEEDIPAKSDKSGKSRKSRKAAPAKAPASVKSQPVVTKKSEPQSDPAEEALRRTLERKRARLLALTLEDNAE